MYSLRLTREYSGVMSFDTISQARITILDLKSIFFLKGFGSVSHEKKKRKK